MGNPASFEAGMLGEGAFWGGNIPEGDAGRSLGPARGMIGIMGSFLNSLSNMLTYGTMAAPAQAPMTMVNVESVAQGIASIARGAAATIAQSQSPKGGPLSNDEVELAGKTALATIEGLISQNSNGSPRTRGEQMQIRGRVAAILAEQRIEQEQRKEDLTKTLRISLTGVTTQEEFEAEAQAAMNFGPQTSNPGAGWGGTSPTNEGNFATIDSSGNITNSLGQTIGQSAVNTTNVGSITDSGGNTIE